MPRRVRVWSAACSTGEEPYSLAMTLLGRFPARVRLGASRSWPRDLSTRVLDQAQAGGLAHREGQGDPGAPT